MTLATTTPQRAPFRPSLVFQCIERFGQDVPPIAIQIITLVDSLFVWVGQAPPASGEPLLQLASTDQQQRQQQQAALTAAARLDQLAVAIPSRHEPTQATASALLRPTLEGHSENMSRRLAARFKQQVFVALGIDSAFEQALPQIERRLHVLVREAIDGAKAAQPAVPQLKGENRMVAKNNDAKSLIMPWCLRHCDQSDTIWCRYKNVCINMHLCAMFNLQQPLKDKHRNPVIRKDDPLYLHLQQQHAQA
ncbi:hypothetical protein HK105_201688 [Polyrhizophydium stewartii]|uniref:Uncharacterized protein n=1 Tax=Polyrhizophydium stewartii TaxID=2732419 RepID=A0ABR4NHC6_9FUNG